MKSENWGHAGSRRRGNSGNSGNSGNRRTIYTAIGAAALCLLTLTAAACASSSGGQTSTPGAPTATPGGQSGGNWQTVSQTSGSSISEGGGNSNSSSQTTSFSANGPYRILAACQGSGSLSIQVRPQGSTTLRCASSRQEPSRVTGGDTSGSGATITVTISPQGNIEWYEVLAQVQR